MTKDAMQSLKALMLLLVLLVMFTGCNNSKKQQPTDTTRSGTIHISADESFKPVIDEQVKVFEANNPGTKIFVHYKPEAECLKDMYVDSIRMVIATRLHTEAENNFVNDSLKTNFSSKVIARDGIAVIVNPAITDSMFTMNEVREILTGKVKENLIPVFDGLKATSTVRFIIDSILKGESLTTNVRAARTSEGVIEYVANNTDAVGFIGVEWIGNPEDTAQVALLKKVRVASIESLDRPGAYVKAYQTNIYLKRYPMVRDLVYILKENHKGLGTGFANFMSSEIGQKIFRRAYLAPISNLAIRQVKLNE